MFLLFRGLQVVLEDKFEHNINVNLILLKDSKPKYL